MVFHFDHLTIDFGPDGKYDPVPLDFVRFKEIFSQWDAALAADGWNSIFLGNHDFSRIVSRFGNDGEYHQESAKLLVLLLMTLRGTPYVYQGDELGMTNIAHDSIEAYDDVETRNAWKAAEAAGKDMDQFLKAVHWQSRDNARTPMQWNGETNAGFTSGTPWIPLNPNYATLNVTAQEGDPQSILHFYRKTIAFRKANPTLVYGDYQDLAPDDLHLFAYRRWDANGSFWVIHNFSDQQQPFPEHFKPQTDQVFGNYPTDHALELRPWESRVYKD